jgi:hypothetical protein
MKNIVLFFLLMILLPSTGPAQTGGGRKIAAPSDVKPGSITCEECPYPYPSSYLPLTLYGQDVRMAYMDVAPQGQPNGHTVVLLHGNNFAGLDRCRSGPYVHPVDRGTLHRIPESVLQANICGLWRSTPSTPAPFADAADPLYQALLESGHS